jgi:iron(III) transport system ATP-binding protein
VAELSVSGVHKAYGRVRALAGVDLTVRSGTLLAVLGPSGCGKTTLLRCVAGFEPVDAGRIVVAGRDVTALAAHRRRIAVVPQEGALFPHLSVFDNVAYGLDRAARRAGRVEAVLALVGLADLAGRMPHQLSGGQQQRVAVARALAPRPPVVLLDEPFSALDAALRADLRRDVRAALLADGATAVLVTHDQGEALSVADDVAVMRAGHIVQSGRPTDVYAAPADPWVAAFVGEAVWLPAQVDNGRARTPLGTLPVVGPPGGSRVLLRPEQIDLAGTGVTEAVVVRLDFHGHDALLGVRLADGTEIAARVIGPSAPPVGAAVSVRVHGTARAYGSPATTGRTVDHQAR